MADPLSIALGAGSIVSGLGGALLGYDSNQEANSINARYNRAMLAFQKYQYEDQKRYNSMTEQVRRIRAAGLNPSLLLQNGTTGMAGSAVSPPSMIPQQPVDIAGLGSAFGSIAGVAGNMVTDFAKASKDTQDALNTAIKNKYEDQQNYWSIDNKKALSYLQGLQGEIAGLDAEYLRRSMGDRLMQQQWQSELTRASAGLQLIAGTYADAEHHSNVYLKLMQAYNAVLTGQASVKQAAAAMKQAIVNQNNSYAMYGISEEDRADFFEATLDQLYSAKELNESSAFRNQFQPFGYQIGSKMFGSVSHTTAQNYQNAMDAYRLERRYERDRRRRNRRNARNAR